LARRGHLTDTVDKRFSGRQNAKWFKTDACRARKISRGRPLDYIVASRHSAPDFINIIDPERTNFGVGFCTVVYSDRRYLVEISRL